MKVSQRIWTLAHGWSPASAGPYARPSQLVLVFGAAALLREATLTAAIRKDYPAAHIFGCSTAGEICGTHVSDDSLVVTAVYFNQAQFRSAQASIDAATDSFNAGELLARQLPATVKDATTGAPEKLVHVMAVTDGLKVNGSEFVAGLMAHLPEGVSVTGGMAGDGVRFSETLVYHGSAAATNCVSALGLYGSRLKVGFGSLGGWDSIGPEMLITRSEGNVLQELDGKPALAVYKEALGGHAKGLPASGLLFPLSVATREGEAPVVRTILNVDEAAQSLTFAGDVPQGASVHLMKANFERLIDGATGAARISNEALRSSAPELAILISCVGRRLVLKERVDEEVRAVRDVLGGTATLAGFYSYGEMSPFTAGAPCELHNQTMTITTLSER